MGHRRCTTAATIGTMDVIRWVETSRFPHIPLTRFQSRFVDFCFPQYYYDRDRARPGAAYPPYEIGGGGGGGAGGYRPSGMGYDNSLNSGDGFGAQGPARPIASRCDDENGFKQIGTRQRVRRQYVRRILPAQSLLHCQRECIDAKDFVCRSFNYRDTALLYDNDNAGTSREREVTNCELSDRDTRELDLQNPTMFDTGSFDYYERSNARSGSDSDCLDGAYAMARLQYTQNWINIFVFVQTTVSQTCNEDGMEFTLRTPEGFYGRIYTYGFYDRCFFRGSGGTINVLRISGTQGYPECGTQRVSIFLCYLSLKIDTQNIWFNGIWWLFSDFFQKYGDTMTNIVVVQFSDNVQTGRDKRFNLTCIFRGPGEAVVTSGYIGAG